MHLQNIVFVEDCHKSWLLAPALIIVRVLHGLGLYWLVVGLLNLLTVLFVLPSATLVIMIGAGVVDKKFLERLSDRRRVDPAYRIPHTGDFRKVAAMRDREIRLVPENNIESEMMK